jgi:hypothetical protein
MILRAPDSEPVSDDSLAEDLHPPSQRAPHTPFRHSLCGYLLTNT